MPPTQQDLHAAGATWLSAKLTPSDIQKVFAAGVTHKRHPLANLLGSTPPGQGSALQSLLATDHALRMIHTKGSADLVAWAAKALARVIAAPQKDYGHADAELAELRCAGSLLAAHIGVERIPATRQPTPDFECNYAGETFVAEVADKDIHGAAATSLKGFNARTGSGAQPGSRVRIREHVVSPMGPRPADMPRAEQVVRAIGDKKGDARQARRGTPGLLWLDLHDENWWHAAKSWLLPVEQSGRDFTSCGFWHAYYGIPGTPYFEDHSIEERAWEEVPVQRTPGQFMKPPLWVRVLLRLRLGQFAGKRARNWSAAAISMASCTALFQNPLALDPLSSQQIEGLFALPRYEATVSLVNWPGTTTVRRRTADAHRLLRMLAKHARYRW